MSFDLSGQPGKAILGRMSRFFTLIATSLLALLPGSAFASSEASVVLSFSDSDKIYLYVSLVLGFVALIAGYLLTKQVKAMSPGNEKMQEVGAAIREGALAYLRKQVRTMMIFVGLLAVGLFFMYKNQYGTTLGVMIAVSFMGGVAASYIAGYVGMLMAVAGNMRTANAALTSYKSSLEVAFRSGAVAGMVTVGMGLIGATLIFLLAGADAMKLLIGFGFGGSLAALFMRVGGGIFTKAADVGADLVGKVEAGIPEDDPRNPATIADNVGDNVGDCAGMAADVFESYEVTLVAAIVLGAATSVIFDQATWMKLILFALMARGVGIVASIIGVFSVRGSDNIDSDPLKAIRRGFSVSAIAAVIGTAAVAYFMMGGADPSKPIQTTTLVSPQAFEQKDLEKIRAIRDRIATTTKKKTYEVTVADIQGDAEIRAMKLDTPENAALIQRATSIDPTIDRPVPTFEGYQKLNFADAAKNPLEDQVGGYAMFDTSPSQTPSTEPKYTTIADFYKSKKMNVYQLKIVQTPKPAAANAQAQPPQERVVWAGPYDEADLDAQISRVEESNKAPNAPMTVTITKQQTIPVGLYANSAGDLAFGVEGKVEKPQEIIPQMASYYLDSPDAVKKASTDALGQGPPSKQVQLAMVENKVVPWYMFLAAIVFGVLMAYAIEWLTDFFVSTHKKPVQEVAGVSSAGPAPMIIQGFALGSASSVYSVFAIVVALLAPLYFFPPSEYGGTYILSFYGIALVGLGLLTTTGYILAMDTFGPISDNAQGVFEMSGAGHDSPAGSKAVQRLDAAGNTTKALTKGFAIATAVVAAVALFHSYVEDARLTEAGMRLEIPEIFLGLLIGGAAPYLFSAFSINAVGRASFFLINEVRRQFKADPGIMAGTSKPDYGRCVAIVTEAAQKELLGPGILAIALPAAVAFGFSIGKNPVTVDGMQLNLTGAQALGGFLAGSILSGQLLAVLLANSGGIWDNAKKLIEDGLYGGKGSEAHKAGVVCDTVGDPFKDTAGPALNPLIKVMNLVALLLAPFVIQPYSNTVLATITIAAVGALAFSIWWSNRSSMSTALSQAAGDAPAIEAAGAPAPDKRKRITVEDSEDTPS